MVVGAAEMPYAKFLLFSVIGGFILIFSMVLAGYYLGTAIEGAFNIKLEDHIEKVVILVVALSLLPPIIELLRHKFGKQPKQDEGAV